MLGTLEGLGMQIWTPWLERKGFCAISNAQVEGFSPHRQGRRYMDGLLQRSLGWKVFFVEWVMGHGLRHLYD